MLNLRQQGIRTIMDLEGLDQTQIQELVEATAVTKSALERALRSRPMTKFTGFATSGKGSAYSLGWRIRCYLCPVTAQYRHSLGQV